MDNKNSAFEAIIDIYNNAPCGFDSVDENGKLLFINDTELKWLGYERAEVVGKKHIYDFFTKESVKIFNDLFPELVKNGGINNVEVIMVRKDGTTFPALVTATAVYDPAGKFLYTRAATTDITKLKEVGAAYRSLFDNMLEGLAYCEMQFDEKNEPVDFTYLAVNKKFEELTGLKNVIGKKVTEIIPGIKQDNPELFAIYGRVAAGGTPEKFETYLPALKLWFSISVYSIEKNRFVAIFDTVTEQKLQEELARLRSKSAEKF